MSLQIMHDVAGHRFTANVDGHLCVLEYRLANSVMTITHTGVPEEVGGRGIASGLMKAALEAARAAGWKVMPACSYAATFLQKHPKFEDLRFQQ